jgi:hypothetical protein
LGKKILYAFLLMKFILHSFLEKLIVTQLSTKFPASNETTVFVAIITGPTTSGHEPGRSLVVGCIHHILDTSHYNGPNWMNHNPYMPTTQTLLE